MIATSPASRNSNWLAFALALVANAVWINASEVFRYFAFVMPMMREAFPQVDDVAPMSLTVFAVWGLWDTVLLLAVTGFVWLCLERFGATARNAVLAGTAFWGAVFVVLWLGLFNMNLAPWHVLAVALPLAWIEMAVAALIVRWAVLRGGSTVVSG
ncbi:MAG: hypothetical protein ACR2OV_14305 [Hyphomicrobiaceae bacterium]